MGDCLVNLASSLYTLQANTNEPGLLDEAAETARRGATLDSAPAYSRMLAVAAWTLSELDAGRPAKALEAVDYAVETLLPELAPHDGRRLDREYGLEPVSGLAAIAAGTALTLGLPDKAVELIERCRGVLAAESIAVQRDLRRLREVAPGLVDEVDTLRRLFERSPDGAGAATDPAEAAALSERSLLAGRWHAVLARIRALDGFTTFLRLPPAPDLAHFDGPVVVIGLFRDDGYALLIEGPSRVRHVPLPGLTVRETAARIQSFLAATDLDPYATLSEREQADQAILSVLGWLWDVVADPVLWALGHTSPPPPGAAWPRVWWCPLGGMALLPLHAAGHHGHLNAVLDRVMSSYTPTLRALQHARGGGRRNGTPRTLVVAVPATPGMDPLPGVTSERDGITGLMPAVTVLEGGHAIREKVLADLPEHAIAHFACHGVSRWDAPSQSALMLADADPLTVADIARLDLDGAGLAYLSACNTGDPSTRVPDEAVHITSAFMLAGFPHAIGTLWPIDDQKAAVISNEFYRRLAERGLDVDAAPHALHDTIRHRRDMAPGRPLEWAGHIHAGR
jgi:hypothetical protein